ncbi:MAG: alpha-amylase family glycosyl hydrolase [Bacteroidota bacterium]|nr:alpha-amylase family glycosyl hydrolase [Bacteroidota bacterium]
MHATGLLKIFILGMVICFSFSCAPQKINASGSSVSSGNEVIYHVSQRSFYDSNSDMIGDLDGLHQKLDYLQDLGITSILLSPLSESVFYHNYFPSDFSKIDSTYGNMDDYIYLAKEIHRRGMKIYFAIQRKVAPVNLKNKKVLEYNINLFKYLVDPDKDGKFDDGVDGFCFDQKPQLTEIFESFWTPVIKSIKNLNPALVNIAEQADWNSWGKEYVGNGGVDRVFAFKLVDALRSFKKGYLSLMADSAFHILPKGKQQVVFIDNSGMSRYSFSVENSLPKIKIGAALNLLLGGVPSIYFGQEIGMTAEHKNTGIWRDSAHLKPGDGISLEEGRPDSNSIYNFYKKMILIRKSNPVISTGAYKNLANTNDYVFTFQRRLGKKAIIVAINLSKMAQGTAITDKAFNFERKTLVQLNGNEYPDLDKNELLVQLPPYGIEVWQISN